MKRLLVNFKIDSKSTNVCVNAVKKAINYDPEYDWMIHLYKKVVTRAVEKLYGKGKYFIKDNSGIEGRGQIWQASKYGGSDSVTGVIYLESNFWDIVE